MVDIHLFLNLILIPLFLVWGGLAYLVIDGCLDLYSPKRAVQMSLSAPIYSFQRYAYDPLYDLTIYLVAVPRKQGRVR